MPASLSRPPDTNRTRRLPVALCIIARRRGIWLRRRSSSFRSGLLSISLGLLLGLFLLLFLLQLVQDFLGRLSLEQERFSREEVGPHGFVDFLPPFLKVGDKVLHVLDAYLLDLTGHHAAGFVVVSYPGELVVVLEEEGEVLVGHVDLGAPAEFFLFLGGVLAAGEGVAVDLVLDLVGLVGEEDGRSGDRGRHLRAGALQGGQEDHVEEGGFLVFHLLGAVATLAEVGVLVDGAGDQAGDGADFGLVRTEDVWEGGCVGGCGLGCGEVEFAYVGAVVEAEGALDLVDGHVLGYHADVLVEGTAHEVEVTEDEGLLGVEAHGDDVFCVLHGVAFCVFDCDFLAVHEFLVVREHDD